MALRSFTTDDEARAALASVTTSLTTTRVAMKTPKEIKKRSGMLRRIGCLGTFFGVGFLAAILGGAFGDTGSAIAGALFLAGFPASLIVPTIIGARKAKLWRTGTPVVATVTRANPAPAMLAPSQMHYRYKTAAGVERDASFAAFGLECPPPQSHILVSVDDNDDTSSVPLFDL